MYEVATRALKQAVRRNIDRFPKDFMFEVTRDGRGKYSKYNPFVFTEQGVAMLARVLRSEKAIAINIQIVRAFVFIRRYALSHKDLTDKLRELEREYNKKFADVYEALKYLLEKDKKKVEQKSRTRIGFKQGKEED